MMHEDIVKKITIERGEIGERNVRDEIVLELANLFVSAAVCLGIGLIAWVALRWILQ
jgi:formate hydrogenlyase subunit 3/multisubunit Na+/H+ antiporter MnhD subunit